MSLIERQHVVDPLAVQHGVAHAERAGAEAGDRAAGLERIAGDFGAVKDFEPIADRIGKHDQVPDAAFVGERARAARQLEPWLFQMRGERIERRRIRHLPAEEARRVARVRMDHEALLAVVHAERERAAALVDQLHAEEPRAVGRPVFQVLVRRPI